MYVDNDFFMVKCELLSDKEKIVSEGPWMLFNHYLVVARWNPHSVSPLTKVKKTRV